MKPLDSNPRERPFLRDVCVIGGCGHVGLPLAMSFANIGLNTVVYDINTQAVDEVRQGRMPFDEKGGPEMLTRVLASGNLVVTDTPELLSECRFVVMVIGTPLDEHLNPSFRAIHRALNLSRPYLRDGQTLILRSTVFPGTSRHIHDDFSQQGLSIGVAFCPERTLQGNSFEELRSVPQIISAFDAETLQSVRALFARLCTDLVEMSPAEAELTKLMCNSWRYIQFAVTNQFFMLATEHGLDYDRILQGCQFKYPRMSSLPTAGFSAGPCLMKDTLQLAAFSNNTFMLGHSAMLVNEGLPAHVIRLLKRKTDLSKLKVGILGMAFKPDCDDPRHSLSYKLRKLLSLECRDVLATDPHVEDGSLLPLDQVLREADILLLATRHRAYEDIAVPEGKRLIDVFKTSPVATSG